MIDYCGTNEADIPVNGGAYIKENAFGGEIYNFLDYNKKCYGFFMHHGDENHIERIEGETSSSPKAENVLVVWTARKPGEKRSIVGWYKDATVYRRKQYIEFVANDDTAENTYTITHEYDICADSKNCFLLPEDERTYIINHSGKSGSGKGMGQSAIWYADSEWAKSELIPDVLRYIDECEKNIEPINFAFDNSLLDEHFPGKVEEKYFNELVDFAKSSDTCLYDALIHINTALKIRKDADAYWIKGDILRYMNQFEPAISCLESAYELDNDINILWRIFILYTSTNQKEKALFTGKLIEAHDNFDSCNDAFKMCIYNTMHSLYKKMHQPKYCTEYSEKIVALDINSNE